MPLLNGGVFVSYDESKEQYKRRAAGRHEDFLKSWYGPWASRRPVTPSDGSWFGPIWWLPLVLLLLAVGTVIGLYLWAGLL